MPPKKAKRKAPVRKAAKPARKPRVRKVPRKVGAKALRKAARGKKKPAQKRKPPKKPAKKQKAAPVRKSARVTLQYRLDPKCKDVENLLGPMELDVLDNTQTGARIVLLGDVHIDKKKCLQGARCSMPIWIYLQNMFQQFKSRNPQDFLDFFLEISFAPETRLDEVLRNPTQLKLHREPLLKGKTDGTSYLTSMRVFFHNCWQKAKEQCEFHGKRIRFHYSDVRAGVIHKEIESKVQEVVTQLHEIRQLHDKPEKFKKHHVEFVLMLVDRFLLKDVDFFFQFSKIDRQLYGSKIDKERRGIQDPAIIHQLKLYMKEHMELERERVFRFKQMLQELLSVMSTDAPKHMKKKIGEMARKTIESALGPTLLTPLFDIYTLARMIRLDMKKVIVFAGAAHTRRMKQFILDHLGFKQRVSEKSGNEQGDPKRYDSFQCISMKNVPQPWFT